MSSIIIPVYHEFKKKTFFPFQPAYHEKYRILIIFLSLWSLTYLILCPHVNIMLTKNGAFCFCLTHHIYVQYVHLFVTPLQYLNRIATYIK